MYGTRSLAIPNGFASQNVSSYNYTNADINYLFNFFSCCYADYAYNYIMNSKRGSYTDGEKCKHKKNLAFMSTGLNLLSTWNNSTIGVAAECSIVMGFYPIAPGGTTTFNLYLSSSGTYYSSPIVASASYIYGGSIQTAFNSLIAQMAAIGFTLTITDVGPDWEFAIQAPLNLGAYNKDFQVVITNTGDPTLTFQALFGGGVEPYNSCVLLSTVQCYVQKMESICGCFNCKSTGVMLKDNVYVSIGQTLNRPSPPVSLPITY